MALTLTTSCFPVVGAAKRCFYKQLSLVSMYFVYVYTITSQRYANRIYIFADDQQQAFKSTLNLLTVSDVYPSLLQFCWNWYLMFWEFAKAISFESLDAENATADDKLSH